MNDKRQKLSKRRDPVAVEPYRDQGYLPEAFVNYLALLGWSAPGGVEHFDREQLIGWFRLEDVTHSPAFFDVAKLTHINGEYIRALSSDDFVEACRPWLGGDAAPWPDDRFDEAAFRRLAPLVQERVSVLSEVPGMVDFVFLEQPDIDEESWAKAVAGDDGATAILDAATAAYGELAAAPGGWTAEALHAATLAVAEEAGRKLGKAQAPIRVAVTGRRVGPPLFEALEVLGPERVLDRLRPARGPCGGRGVGGGDPGDGDRGEPAAQGAPGTLVVVLVVVAYFAVTGVQVWLTGRRHEAHPAGAIVVMGAAQYDGVPSPDLAARLDEAYLLWKLGYADVMMVTGSKEPGDQFTESEAGTRYLEAKGVPAGDIEQVGGADSWQNL